MPLSVEWHFNTKSWIQLCQFRSVSHWIRFLCKWLEVLFVTQLSLTCAGTPEILSVCVCVCARVCLWSLVCGACVRAWERRASWPSSRKWLVRRCWSPTTLTRLWYRLPQVTPPGGVLNPATPFDFCQMFHSTGIHTEKDAGSGDLTTIKL